MINSFLQYQQYEKGSSSYSGIRLESTMNHFKIMNKMHLDDNKTPTLNTFYTNQREFVKRTN